MRCDAHAALAATRIVVCFVGTSFGMRQDVDGIFKAGSTGSSGSQNVQVLSSLNL